MADGSGFAISFRLHEPVLSVLSDRVYYGVSCLWFFVRYARLLIIGLLPEIARTIVVCFMLRYQVQFLEVGGAWVWNCRFTHALITSGGREIAANPLIKNGCCIFRP